jgi:long-subunit acyl-CoA synthetase (AMP-forming)
VHGDPLKSSIVAICVPCADTLSQWAKDNNQEFDMVKLCVDASVIQMILKVFIEAYYNHLLIMCRT